MSPCRVAIHSDQDIVQFGLRVVLRSHPDEVEIVPAHLSDSPSHIDVLIYDASCLITRGEGDLDRLTHAGVRVLVLGMDGNPATAAQATLVSGVGLLFMSASRDDLVRAVIATGRGEAVMPSRTTPLMGPALSVREMQILFLIAQGLSNVEIAQILFLSINSVKTHVRTAYRKIEVSRRSQAVAWATGHGYHLVEVPDLSPVRRGDGARPAGLAGPG